ncbi:hypothetical protein [Zunongwangia profunda]|uniref:hypothetical protein n=1 Tax=Zunongwangia profunda TaxID=398743 RepID=UPI000C8E08C7|nr:hypothetical protein [Zunongwangia profunda]MAG88801.1 hypothetical protein [Flavobacteriaceae bacterium]
MNPFHVALLNYNSIPKDIQEYQLRIELGVNTVLTDGILFFNAYESSKYPEVICDTKYFFIYSTDHAVGSGGLYWGKGNELDLSDFQEIALITSGYQSETPVLMRIPAEELPDNEVLHLFYHTVGNEPGNSGYQQTRLITSQGGSELHTMSWTDRGRPLGILSGENHTGYFRPQRIGPNNYRGTHITKGGIPQPWYFSTSTDGRVWTRSQEYDARSFVPEVGDWIKPSYGDFFDYLGRKWWIGTLSKAQDSENTNGVQKQLVLCKSNNNFQVTEIVQILNNGNYTRNHGVKIDGNLAYIYTENPSPSNIYSSKFDLRNLKKNL